MIAKRIKLLMIIALWFVNFHPGNAQDQSNFIHLNPVLDNDVLRVSKSVEDDFGYIWLLHNSGFSKYDGYYYSFIPFEEIFGDHFTNDRDFTIHKDDHGYIWISSFNGELTRIDKFGVYLSFKDRLSQYQRKKQILAMTARADDVWFGSKEGGIYNYNYRSNTFDSITTIPSNNIAGQRVRNMAHGEDNSLWISTNTGYIYNYSLRDKKLTTLKGAYNTYSSDIRIVNDLKGRLWIATESQGLFFLNSRTDSLEPFRFPEHSFYGLKKNMFIFLICDSAGNIWAGTDGDGLYRINPETGAVNLYEHNELNEYSLKNNTVTHINEDSHGNVWIRNKKEGIDILLANTNKIRYHSGSTTNAPSRILSVLKATDGTLWTGTDGDGLNRLKPDGTSVQYDFDPSFKNAFSGRFIQSIAEDHNGHIWVGTYQAGLWIFNKEKNSFTKFPVSDSRGLFANDIRFLFRDSKNRIWVSAENGIYVYAEKKLLASFKGHDNGLYGEISQSICEDEKGTIWLGINQGGLFEFKEDETQFKKSFFKQHLYYKAGKEDGHNYNIASMAVDNSGHIWIVTVSGPLIKYNKKERSYISFLNKDEFKPIAFSAVLTGKADNIWLSSNKGIVHFNTKTEAVKFYYQTDGLHSNNFLKRSCYKDPEGYLYFGGVNGLNYFLPANMQKKETFAALHINNIEILNQPAKSIIPEQLEGGIMQVDRLKLRSEQSSFSFQFSAIDNVLNPHFHYAYRLRGFNDNWIVPKRDLMATYTNIPHGKYSFEVKAGSRKGLWDIPAKSIQIKIAPPWWLSPWAYGVYFISVLFLTYGFIVWLRLKNKLAKEEWRHHKEKELYALKMNFFTKMSHEIQTPLTLILGPIEDMLKRAEEKGNAMLKKRLAMISNNARRLSRIAMELTSTRDKELGQLRLQVSQRHLVEDLKNIAFSFEEQASFRQIEFIQQYPDDPLLIWYDKDKIEHVIYNLLSNAFKFTPKKGRVKMIVKKDPSDDEVYISITDSGPGIPKEELEKIFILFYQSEAGKQAKGTGIGLALTKELVELHHGQIKVSTSSEKGTCFTLSLSAGDRVFSDDEKVRTKAAPKGEVIEDVYSIATAPEASALEQEVNKDLGPKTILIVEDNYEMQIFLRNVFREHYHLLFADNGKEGIVLAEKNRPNLIISDVVMPEVDGIEMCKILQKKKSTLHIPIILLSARNQENIKIRGLKSGAVEFLHKPFNIHELILKVNNFIARSEKVISKYRTERISTPESLGTKSVDDLFMENLVKEINLQLDNSEFKLEDLSKAMNRSYSVIYRKCQSITGKTLVEFVRFIRIKKATVLFTKYGHGISEAAYMAGFNNPKYFAKCFKKEFGKSPNAFKKHALKMGVNQALKKYNLEKD